MASGVLTVIGCPVLEDELLYGILKDNEDKDIYVVEAEPSKSLRRKFERYNIPYVSISGQAFINRKEIFNSSRYSIVIKMLDIALHLEPKYLRSKVEEEVVSVSHVSDVIALYYGMCGNVGWDASKWAEENGLCPVLVFRDEKNRVCDDCVSVAVGGIDNYLKLLKAHTGQMLFTPGVAVNWIDFMDVYDTCKDTSEKSVESMKCLFKKYNYDTVVEIDTGLGDSEEMRKATKEFAETYDFNIVKAEDHWPNLYPAERIYSDAKQFLNS